MPTNNWNSLLCTSYEFHYTITQTDPNNCLAHWLRVICGLQSSFGLTAPEMPLSKRRRTDRGVFFELDRGVTERQKDRYGVLVRARLSEVLTAMKVWCPLLRHRHPSVSLPPLHQLLGPCASWWNWWCPQPSSRRCMSRGPPWSSRSRSWGTPRPQSR
jgi:hypothetical protein